MSAPTNPLNITGGPTVAEGGTVSPIWETRSAFSFKSGIDPKLIIAVGAVAAVLWWINKR